MSTETPEGPFWLEPDEPPAFPPTRYASREPDGLLALGGALTPDWLLASYRHGIFPWYSDDQPILWWSPDPRAVLFPERLKVSRSLGKSLRNRGYTLSLDTCFSDVIDACAAPRSDDPNGELGTWITEEMRAAYIEMHRLGHAHSVEVWLDGQLVGGLYGIAMGRVFFGESMFSRARDASKVALVRLVEWLKARGFGLIDCQQASGHLMSLGAESIPRNEFEALLEEFTVLDGIPGPWSIEGDAEPLHDPSPLERLPHELKFGISHEHPCNYLPGNMTRYMVAVPELEADEPGSGLRMDMGVYSTLVELGFRRSNGQAYAPHCNDCNACRSVRVPVAEFCPNRSQRRALKANAELEMHIRPAAFDEEHFALYRRYQAHRHSGDSMDSDDPSRYSDFLFGPWSRTELFEFRHEGRLLAVAVTDVLDHGLSAVYTFFDPDEGRRGLGSYAVLRQIEECRRRGLPHLYLGYWIGECAKMSYKTRFQPLEQFYLGRWQALEADADAPI